MDAARFTARARSLAARGTRRGVLRGLAGGVLGVVAATEAADARRGRRKRKRSKAPGSTPDGSGGNGGHPPGPGAATCTVCKNGRDCPFTSIQASINAARAGATITVCDGAYNENITIGKNLTLAAAAGANVNVKLDGSGKGSVVTVPKGVTASLQALEITDGGSTPHGGAVFNQGNLTLTNLLIQDNQAREGAGVYNDLGAQLHLDNTVVQENDATNSGGGIYNLGTLLVTNGSLIFENEAPGSGGGLSNFGGAVTISGGSVVEQNKAPQGGGIMNGSRQASGSTRIAATLTIEDSFVRDNTANPSGDVVPGGGGIFNAESTVTLRNSQVVGNKSATQGGGIFNLGSNRGATVTIDAQSKVVDNKPNNCSGTTACR